MPTCNYQFPDWLRHDPCPEPAWDGDGRCFFHSERSDRPAAGMAERVKEKLARGDNDFAGYVFPARVDLSGLAFGGGASFLGAKFGDRASFARATFGKEASFFGAKFGDRASFDMATFGKEASFLGAKFGNWASFVGAQFGDRASFVEATFGQGASFVEATFGDGANFAGAKFGDGASFRIANPAGRFILQDVTFKGEANFSDVTQDLSHFEFHQVTLPRGFFRGAIGLDRAEFDMVRWGERGGRRGILGDEEKARQRGEPADFDAAERVYREIRRSYLARRDFTMNREMHWGEMEMRRLKEVARKREAVREREDHRWLGRLPLWRWLNQIPLWPHFSLTTAYWLVSGYGLRWRRALASLGLLGAICSLLYVPELMLVHNPPLDFWQALVTGAMQGLFSLILRPLYAPLTLGGEIVNFLQMALSPIIITTLVLAVREQFRR